MTAAGFHNTDLTHVTTDRATVLPIPATMRQTAVPPATCPHWCERPPGHDWEDDIASPELMRVHRHTFPIPGTDHGSLMVLLSEYHGPAGSERGPMKYVIDTGLSSDCELGSTGVRGLATVLAEALTLTAEPP
ncbi:hypothetical protein [Nocardia sp. NPDC051570]|uniref:hypothetical protein n=1 Tax=Nocardia sp. NPDC051570 TaxID=3364324 RepID=UPI0037B4A428